ncbi:MAG: hypothetical protein ACOX8P_11115 [Tepidanaerobacteraceae bacterium]
MQNNNTIAILKLTASNNKGDSINVNTSAKDGSKKINPLKKI